jgi:hypothetical protein
MESMNASYRQLNTSRSREQLSLNAEKSLNGLEVFSHELLEINDFSYRTPAVYSVSSDEYLEIRSQIISIILSLSIGKETRTEENQSARIDVNKISFDRKLTEIALNVFPMNPHEASNRDVWSYISLRVLPDVAMWRFPNRSNDPEWERYFGSDRNTFKRLWWRSYMLGGPLAAELDEDELVQMFERTESIGSNKIIMRSMATFALDSREDMKSIGGKASSLITEIAKSLRRSMAIISYESMTDNEIDAFVKHHGNDALNRIRISREK